MKIIYRVSRHQSPNKSPIYSSDKWMLASLCHDSFLEAGGKDYDVTYICDNGGWPEYFSPFGKVIETSLGNEGTFHLQIDLACENNEPTLLVEDDYLWRPNTLKTLHVAIEKLGLVSPYDHPAHYLEERFDKHYNTTLIDGYTYREAPSNTLTFGATSDVFKTHKNTFKSYGTNDHEMFTTIIATGQKLWNPCNSIATHMVENHLAPNVDWSSMW